MGLFRGSELSPQNNIGVSHTLQSKATSGVPRYRQFKITCSRINQHDSDHKQDERARGTRKGNDLSKLSIINVSSCQKRRLISTDFQLKGIKPICHDAPFQAHKCSAHTRFPTTERLVVQNRPLTSLFSPSYCAKPQEISAPLLSQGTPGDDLLTIRPEYGSTNVCSNNELDNPNFQRARNKNYRLPGRFSVSQPGQKHPTGACGESDSFSKETRMGDKFRKIIEGGREELSVFGDTLESLDKQKESTSRQVTYINVSNRPNVDASTNKPQKSSKSCRDSQFCQFCSTQGQAQLSRSFKILEQNFKATNQNASRHSIDCNGKSTLVATKLQAVNAYSFRFTP